MTEGLTLEIEMRPEASEHDTALVTRYWALESVDQGRVVYREQPVLWLVMSGCAFAR